MAIRKSDIRGTDGRYHSWPTAGCRDGSKLSYGADTRWWAVQNDCNGIFSIHRTRDGAKREASEIGSDSYAVPIVVLYDTDELRYFAD